MKKAKSEQVELADLRLLKSYMDYSTSFIFSNNYSVDHAISGFKRKDQEFAKDVKINIITIPTTPYHANLVLSSYCSGLFP